MTQFEAILWDCDGCLIDSEHLVCGLTTDYLNAAGYAITTEDFIRRFCGQHKDHIYNTISAEVGFDILTRIDMAKKDAEQNALFQDKLQVIPGITAVLQALTMPMAVASGTGYPRLHYTLELTGLRDRFDPHIYSSSDVAHSKPAPDVFLYAADKLGVAPADCLVIEDSLNGVRSGKAAGMTVFGFAGGSHILDRASHMQELTSLGADWVFDDMRALTRMV